MKTLSTSSLLLHAAAIFPLLVVDRASAFTYNVIPGADSTSSDDVDFYSISDALDKARAGDTILLGNGVYTGSDERLASTVDGEEGNPITISGGREAVIQANSPSVLIEHSWITLEGFTVDGEHDSSDDIDSYVNKCVEVDGDEDGIEGFVMTGMTVMNCGGECVRLKNFVSNSQITDNTIEHCGVYDYQFNEGKKNGEGIYIGTSNKQWDYGEDRCNDNLVSGNFISTCGNECVEVKEGSSGNMVENNVCSNQLDKDSGCFGSRGDENTFRYNEASNCDGAGVRLGGNTVDGVVYGKNNNVYENSFISADAAAISVRVLPQGTICGNDCEDGPCDITKNEDVGDIEENWDAECPVGDDDDDDKSDDDDNSRDDDDSGDDDDDSGDDDDDSGDDDDDSGDDDDDSGDDDDDSGDDDDDNGDDDDDSGDDDDDDDYQSEDDGDDDEDSVEKEGDDDSKEGRDDDGDDYQ